MKLRFVILSLGLLASVTNARSDAPRLSAALASRFEGDRTGVCVVAVRIDGAQAERATFCAPKRVADASPSLGSAFEIGSVTKTMTSFLVADLIASGKWSLDDPIAAHLPAGTAVPRQGERQILVRDLLTHTSGLPALPSRLGGMDPRDPYAALSEPDLLASLGDVRLTRPIGSEPQYSNFGMMVVSDAVSRAYGTSYEAALKARLFDPLDMKGAFVTTPAPGEAVAVGHTARGTPTPAWTITPNLAGVGMVKATLDDMERYAMAEMVDGPLASRLRMTQQPLSAGFAMNWMLRRSGGRDLLVHEGGTGGFSSFVGLDTARHIAVVILADTALTDLGGLGDVGLALLDTGTPIAPPRRAIPVPARLLQAMQGDFDLGALKLHVRAEGVRLFAQATGQTEFELLYDDHGDFYPSTFDALLTPMNVGGRVDCFVWKQGGGALEGTRAGLAESPVASGASLASDCDGTYRLTPQFSLRIFRADGNVQLQGTGQPATTAAVTGPDRIEVKAAGAVVKFNRDQKGAVVGATLLQGGAVIEGIKQ
jgi:D-alanyl-D-alanine-carboxypeptidase/D-alanyl-D-alanine-endopeptidase